MNQSPSSPPSKHNAIAAWVFGSLILLFYMGVFFFAPAELPDYKHKQLAIFSALLCALFTFFFVGTLKLTLEVKNKWSKLGIQGGGGAAAFVLILVWWNNPDFTPVHIKKDIAEIKSSIEETKENAVSIKNDTQTIVSLLQNELSVKNTQIAFLQTQLQTQKPEISAKAKELAKQIPDTADNYALALKAIAEERFDVAMQLLDKAQVEQETGLANIYTAKGDTQYYQGLYAKAAQWYQKALALKPDDPVILNNTGLMLDHAGQYDQAEPLVQHSLAISEKALGKDHPTTKTIRENLKALQSRQKP